MAQFGDEIRQAIEKNFPTIKSAAEKIKISPEYLRRLCTDFVPDPDKTVDTYNKLINGLGLDKNKLIILARKARAPEEDKHLYKLPSELKTYTGILRGAYKIDTSKLRKIPVISWVHAGQWTEQIDNYPPGWAEEYIYSDVKGEHVFACKVHNDCMTPEFTEGEYVIVNPDIQVENGNFIVARNKETNETCLRQYKVYGKTKILHCLNLKYEDEPIDHRFVIVGKVVEKKKIY